jgi:hypothetical protein
VFLVLSPDEVVVQAIENEEEFDLIRMRHVLKTAQEEVSRDRMPMILRQLLEKLSQYKLVRLE